MSAVLSSEKVVNRNVRFFLADTVVESLRNMPTILRANPWCRFSDMLSAIIGENPMRNGIESGLLVVREDRVKITLSKFKGVHIYDMDNAHDFETYTLYNPAFGPDWEHETIHALEMQDIALSEELVRQGFELYPESEVE